MLVFLFSLFALAAVEQPQAPADFIAAVHSYETAIVAGNRATLEQLLHDEFLITSGDGQTRDKKGELADLVADGFKVHEFKLDAARYRVVGTTGIATGILRWRMTFQGRETMNERLTSMTWVKEGSAWRMLGQHVSRLK